MVIVVTGAAGDIGRAIRQSLENDGVDTIGLDLVRSDDVEICIDLSDTRAVRTTAATLSKDSSICGIVHVAADQPLSAIGSYETSAWEHAMRVNCLSLDALTGGLSRVLASNEGSIVAVSSIHAHETAPYMGIYAATKAALESWVRSAAIELAPAVTVNTVALGAVEGRKLEEGLERHPPSLREDVRSSIRSRAPAGRLGQPAEIGALVSFLIGSQCRFLTGASLATDGGSRIRLAGE